MSNGAWDWERQRADTEAVWAELCEKYDLERGMAINLDLQFVAVESGDSAGDPPGDSAGEAGDAPGVAPDKPGFVAALREAGYALSIYPNDEGVETVEATTATTFDPAAIWAEEERGTRMALAHGYRPDGWGFWEPEST